MIKHLLITLALAIPRLVLAGESPPAASTSAIGGQLLECALKTAATLPADQADHRARIELAIALAYAHAGESDRALALAEKLTGMDRVDVWVAVAGNKLAENQEAAARQLIEQALALAEQLEQEQRGMQMQILPEFRSGITRGWAALLLRQGRLEKALAAADKTIWGERTALRIDVAKAYAARKDLDRAEQILRELRELGDDRLPFAAIDALIEIGRTKDLEAMLRRYFQEALRQARKDRWVGPGGKPSDFEGWDTILPAVASRYLKLGLPVKVAEVARAIRGDEILPAIIEILVDARQSGLALELAGRIKYRYTRVATLGQIAASLEACGNQKEAERLLKRALKEMAPEKELRFQVDMLESIAQEYLAQKLKPRTLELLERAVAIADKTKDQETRDGCVSGLASVFAVAGECPRALALIETLKYRDYELVQIAPKCTAAETFERLKTAAAAMEFEENRADFFLALARQFLAEDRLALGVDCLLRIETPKAKALGLVALGELCLARPADKQDSCKLARELLASKTCK